MLITSQSNSKIKEIKKLFNKKYSLEKGLFIIEGENLISEAIKKKLLKELYVLDGYKCEYSFEYNYVTLNVMKSLSDMKSIPRLLGVCSIKNNTNLGKKIVILDNIQDPGNAGTIIRTSVAFGIDCIVFSPTCVSPYNEKVLRSSGGMIFNINIIIEDTKKIIQRIENENIKVIGSSLHTNKYLESIEKTDKYAIILGNEGSGLSREILDLCDEVIKIDMNKSCESLNVGISGGIILYYLFKR